MFFRSNKGEVLIIKEHSSNGDALSFIQGYLENPSSIKVKTSGSTGKPKLIELSSVQIKASVRSSATHFDWNGEDLFVCNLNITSIAGKMMIIRALELKASLLFIPPISKPLDELYSQRQILETFKQNVIFAFVPLQVEYALKTSSLVNLLNYAKTILIGGAQVAAKLLEKVKQIYSPVFATYGMTETVTHIATKRLNGNNPNTSFRTLPEIEIKTNLQGCLQIKAPQTNQQWIVTNDLVELKSTNEFFYIGRADNTINSGGIKIQLEKIESLIEKANAESFEFFAFPLEDEKLGQALSIAFIPTEKAMKVFNRTFMKEVLPKFEVPKYFFPVDKFEFTESGKIDKIKTINVHIRNQVSD